MNSSVAWALVVHVIGFVFWMAGLLVVTQVMEFPFAFVPGEAIGAASAAILVTVVLGLIGTLGALNRKPAEVLRDL